MIPAQNHNYSQPARMEQRLNKHAQVSISRPRVTAPASPSEGTAALSFVMYLWTPEGLSTAVTPEGSQRTPSELSCSRWSSMNRWFHFSSSMRVVWEASQPRAACAYLTLLCCVKWNHTLVKVVGCVADLSLTDWNREAVALIDLKGCQTPADEAAREDFPIKRIIHICGEGHVSASGCD